MYALMIYSLKAGACLAVFYLFFKLLLSRDTLHRLNRVVLLGAMVLSFVLPLCVITVYREIPVVPQIMEQAQELAPETPVEAVAEPFPWDMIFGGVFVAGAVAALVATFVSLTGVVRMIRRGRRERLEDGTVLVRVDEKLIPFSWGRYVVVSEDDLAESGGEILLHERAHLRLRHSLDLMLTDIAGCLQWFNPAMWLMRRELRAIHEYEADEAVLSSGVDAKRYQLLLIKKAAGGKWYSIANSFNHSKLKNRINMMLRKRSTRMAGAKALFLLPLTALALGAFARTAYVFPEPQKQELTVHVTGDNYTITDQDGTMFESNSMDSLKEVMVVGAGTQPDSLRERMLHISKDDQGTVKVVEVDKRVKMGAQDKNGIRIRGINSDAKNMPQPLYVIDGVPVEGAGLEDLRPEDIREISIIKDSTAMAMYGEKAKNGVILITTKNGTSVAGGEGRKAMAWTISETGRSKSADGKETVELKLSGTGVNGSVTYFEKASAPISSDALYVLNGIRISKAQFGELSPAQIESITVMKDASATALYGSSGRNGVVLITSKDNKITFQQTKAAISEARKALAQAQDALVTNKDQKVARDAVKQADDALAKVLAAAEKSGKTQVENAKDALTREGMPRMTQEKNEDGEQNYVYKGRITADLSNVSDKYLILIDGERADKAAVGKIAPRKIKRMEVIKGEDAVKEYGPEASFGVIDITTRR